MWSLIIVLASAAVSFAAFRMLRRMRGERHDQRGPEAR